MYFINDKLSSVTIIICTVVLCCLNHTIAGDIHIAVKDRDIKAVSELIDKHGSDIIQKKLKGSIYPLHIAAALNDSKMTAMLLAMGAKVDAKTDSGYTALHWATKKDADKSAELLIRFGADMDAKSNKGLTPLHWGAHHNASNTVKLLIMSGANIYQTSDTGYKPLHWAVINESSDVYAMLVFKEASDRERSGVAGPALTKDYDKYDWADMLANPGIAPTEPVFAENSAKPVKGEAFTLSLGHNIALEFTWLRESNIWIGTYEVTNEQYRQFKPNHSSLFREDFSLNDNKQPAVYLNWQQAKVFCTWLNRKYGQSIPDDYTFRLPAEDEWMTAASCGTDRAYPWGETLPPSYGNYSDASLKHYVQDWKGIKGYNDSFVVSCKVDDSGANEWGIYGLAGNVWEWCEDWYDNSYKYKTLHGGSWDYDEEHMIRIDSRGFDRPDTRDDTIGFRVVIAKKQ